MSETTLIEDQMLDLQIKIYKDLRRADDRAVFSSMFGHFVQMRQVGQANHRRSLQDYPVSERTTLQAQAELIERGYDFARINVLSQFAFLQAVEHDMMQQLTPDDFVFKQIETITPEDIING